MTTTEHVWAKACWPAYLTSGEIKVSYFADWGVFIFVPPAISKLFTEETMRTFVYWLAARGDIPASYAVFDVEDGQLPVIWVVKQKRFLVRLARKLLRLFE